MGAKILFYFVSVVAFCCITYGQYTTKLCDDHFYEALAHFELGSDALAAENFDAAILNFTKASEAYNAIATAGCCTANRVVRAVEGRKRMAANIQKMKSVQKKFDVYDEQKALNERLQQGYNEALAQFKLGRRLELQNDWGHAKVAFIKAELLWKEVAREADGGLRAQALNKASVAKKALLATLEE